LYEKIKDETPNIIEVNRDNGFTLDGIYRGEIHIKFDTPCPEPSDPDAFYSSYFVFFKKGYTVEDYLESQQVQLDTL